jgi:anti-sigma factor RsiW
MDCADSALLLDAAIDGELDIASLVRLERHQAICPACQAEHARRVALRTAIRTRTTRHAASDALAARIARSLAERRTEDSVAVPQPVGQVVALRAAWRRRLGSGAGLVASALAASLVTVWIMTGDVVPRAPGEPVLDQIVASHVRSLMANHLTDVVSSDRHTVKPWFAAKLPLAPPVKDLPGFELIGGRLDYIAGHPTAAIVYRRDKHLINLFVWSIADAQPSESPVRLREGYAVCEWAEGGLAYWAVSDMDPQGLEAFRAAVDRAS